MPDERKLRVFLCHASQDKPVVRELYQRLLTEGWVDPWLDEEKLLPGQDWDMEIEKAVETADVVIVCLSNKSVSKEGYIQRELKFVLDIALEKPEGTIFVIPLRLDDCDVPRRIRSWQYVDYFPISRKNWAYSRIVNSLQLRFENQVGGSKSSMLSRQFEYPKNVSKPEQEKPAKPIDANKFDVSFFIWWVIGMGITYLICYNLGVALLGGPEIGLGEFGGGYMTFVAGMGLYVGLPLGIVQILLLRKKLKISSWLWILVSMLGWLICWVILDYSPIENWVFVFSGTVVGLIHTLILYNKIRNPIVFLYLLACVLGWGISIDPFVWSVTFVTRGFVVGLTTGVSLDKIIRSL